MANGITLKNIVEIFLVSIAWTLTLYSPLAKSRLTGNGFVKLLSNIALGCLSLSLFNDFFSAPFMGPGLYLKLISMFALATIFLKHKEDKTPLMWVMYFIVVFALGLHLIFLSPGIESSLFVLSSALLLGSVLFAMILGHWYLVVPKLSAGPLKIAAIIIWSVLLGKLMFSAGSIWNNLDYFLPGSTRGEGMAFNSLLMLMRISFGYVIILGMSILNWRLIKIRSIQSSTGVLYAMTFFCFIGEIVSLYMYFNLGLFI